MSSSRKAIYDQIVAVLQTITKAHGYNNDVVAVTKMMKGLDRVSSFPELVVVTGPQVKKPSTEEEGLYEVEATFGVVGFVMGAGGDATGGSFSDAADGLVEDIETAILSDTTIVATTEAKRIWVTEDEPVLVLPDKNAGYVMVGLSVLYYHDSNV